MALAIEYHGLSYGPTDNIHDIGTALPCVSALVIHHGTRDSLGNWYSLVYPHSRPTRPGASGLHVFGPFDSTGAGSTAYS